MKSGGGVLCVLPGALIFLREPKKLRSKHTRVRNAPNAITCGDNGQLQRKNGVLHLDWKELCEGLMGKYRCLALCKRQQQKRIYLAGETEENKAGSDSENFQHLETLDNIHWAVHFIYWSRFPRMCKDGWKGGSSGSDSPNTQPVTSWTLAECWRWGTASPSCLIYLRACP